ncbi:MOSC domain-containing protein [Halorarius litoreus]|uniref:MOSC domain-containing protein n=1 Tax=Halorarius litoreus TaxID=2962676 RepID=UPI0020CD1E70|nr:MOSC domain-containing protein [Halorarius litoreus]
MTEGTVEYVHVAPEEGAPPQEVDRAEAVARRGLRGDRYFADAGTFADRSGSDLSLIEAEALDGVERDYGITLEPGLHRRNVTTRGVALNHLVGREFLVGDVLCEGTELCEPCSYLERHLAKEGIREALVHRGGLRATIVEGGTIEPGDAVRLA